MKKNLKIKALALGAVVTVGVGVICLNTTVAKAEETPDFYVRGAAVRFAQIEENSGIRFSVLMEKTKYETMIAQENAKMGVYLIPQDLLVDANENGWDDADFVNAENAVFVDETKNIWFESEVEGYMEALAYIYDFPAGSYNRPISAVAYANGEFTESVERSFAGVALAAVEAGEVEREVVSAYLSQEYTVQVVDDGTITGTEGAVLDSKTYTYGQELALPQIPEVFGKTFLGVYARVGTAEGEAVWSETLTEELTDNVVRGNMQFKVSYGDFMRYAGVGAQDAYKIGNFVIAKTDFAKGTVVDVTLKLKYSGEMFANKWLWTRYTDANGSMEVLTQPDSSSSVYQEFTEVTFTAQVGDNGEIALEVRNSNGGSAEYCVEVKDVVVAEEEKVLKFAGTSKTGDYLLGEFVIANTEYAKDSYVEVTMKLKLSGNMYTRGKLWTTIKLSNVENKIDAVTEQDTTQYSNFEEVTFISVVGDNGQVVLVVRCGDAVSNTYCVEAKDIQVKQIDYRYYDMNRGSTGNDYWLGDIAVGTTNLPAGTKVTVTVDLKITGKDVNSKYFAVRYVNGEQKVAWLIEDTYITDYRQWKTVTFTTYVGMATNNGSVLNKGDQNVYLQTRLTTTTANTTMIQVRNARITVAE